MCQPDPRASAVETIGLTPVVELVDQAPGSKVGQVSGADLELVEKETERIVRERKAFRADQFKDQGNFRIQGGGYSMKDLPLLNRAHIDGFITVSDREAMEASRALAKKEGIFAGFSSGANVAAALKLLNGECKGRNIAVLINDSGLKYLSADLWE